MRLSALLDGLPQPLAPAKSERRQFSVDPIIRGIGYDSRTTSPGDLFVALRGSVSDGHDYIERAVNAGAVAVLAEEALSPKRLGDAVAVVVPDTRQALAELAQIFFGRPSESLSLIGITGTNGKTSTSYLVESILKAAEHRTALIGTVEIRYAGARAPAVNTTPESLDLQRTLRDMCTQGIEDVVMEVSSHGLELGRVRGCHFNVAAFTNLTQDHLDFHGSMEAYRSSKARLFGEFLNQGGTAVINIDDPSAPAMIEAAQASEARLIRCARQQGHDADVWLENASIRIEGTRARVHLDHQPLDLEIPLLGDFNLENVLIACGIGHALGLSPEEIARGIQACPQVPGRMEVVRSKLKDSPTVLVDYAHTPDAIEKLLTAVRPLSRGRILTVFGCGGDRDRTKRPLMAEAVARQTDLAIATSDNPRRESPEQILRDVEQGLRSLARSEPENLPSRGAYTTLIDRRAAIQCAIAEASPEDTVVIAGKGHEDYQIIGTQKLPFDDRQEASRALDRGVQN